MDMKRILIALFIAAAPAAWADAIPLPALSEYLTSLKSAASQFKQTNPDGTTSAGVLMIKRPGRMRFDYNPPEQAMVIAGGGQLAVFDPKSNTGPDRYPLNQTPLSIILKRKVDLTKADNIVGHRAQGDYTIVSAVDPENREYGTLHMVFAKDPVRLIQWTVDDGAGNSTRIALQGWKEGVTLKDRMFNIQAEMAGWAN